MAEDMFDRFDRECRESAEEEPEDVFTTFVEVVDANGNRVYALLPNNIPVEEQAKMVDDIASRGGERSGL